MSRAAKHDAAIKDFDEAIRLRPGDASSYRARAQARMATGNHAAAIEDYDRLVALEPRNVMNYINRGGVHERGGAVALARDDYRKAIEQAPDGSALRSMARERLKRITGDGI